MLDWWNHNLPKRLPEFEGWLKGPMDETRLPVRKLVRERFYTSFLDIGAGLAAEYEGFKQENYQIRYCGVEPCVALRHQVAERCGIILLDESLPHLHGLIPRNWDVVHCRGVLEHLPAREDALLSINNMVRCAHKCVLISFFMPPADPEQISETIEGGAMLWHNRWSRQAIEDHLRQMDDCVKAWRWHPLPRGFELLEIEVR